MLNSSRFLETIRINQTRTYQEMRFDSGQPFFQANATFYATQTSVFNVSDTMPSTAVLKNIKQEEAGLPKIQLMKLFIWHYQVFGPS